MILMSLGSCLSHVSHWHMPLKKKRIKDVTEQLPSNSVLAQIFRVLWTLSPGAAACCLFQIALHAIRACIRKHNILQFIY